MILLSTVDASTDGTAGFGPNTNCWNFKGHFVCTCKVLFPGSPTIYCYDIDGCINPELHDCVTVQGYNTETFGRNGIKYFDVDAHMHQMLVIINTTPSDLK